MCTGFNNQYLCQTDDELAITYNDSSPLENMHCATAFTVAHKTGILKDLPAKIRSMFRKQVVVSRLWQVHLSSDWSNIS